jgi:hypothetical protein
MPLHENVPEDVKKMAFRIARYRGEDPEADMSSELEGRNLENFPEQWMIYVSDAKVFLGILAEDNAKNDKD